MAPEANRFTIRPTAIGDLEEVRSLWNDGRVMKWVNFPDGLGYSRRAMEEWFALLEANSDRHHFVVRSEDVGFCGEVYYRVASEHRRASLDIKFLPEAQGLGLATEALTHLIELVFDSEDDIDLVWTQPWPDNRAALDLYTRCGMAPEPIPTDLVDSPTFWVRRRAG